MFGFNYSVFSVGILIIISFNFVISEQFTVLFVWIKTFHDCILGNKSERFQKVSQSK